MVNEANWDICQSDFNFDGALIDLLVPDTDGAEWEIFWEALKSGPFELLAFQEGTPIPLPGSAAKMLEQRKKASVMVSIILGTVTANCHFFGGNLEMDIDPRQVTGEAGFQSVLEIMRFIATAADRPVYAVPEGSTLSNAFLRVLPDGQAVSLP